MGLKSETIWDTCANCGEKIHSYNNGFDWYHVDQSPMCPRRWAKPTKYTK